MNKRIIDYVVKRQQTIWEKTFDKNRLKKVEFKSIDINLLELNKTRSIENAENYKRKGEVINRKNK